MDKVIGFTVQMEVGGWIYCAFIVGMWIGWLIHSFSDWVTKSNQSEAEARQNIKDAENILADCNKDNQI